METAFKSIVSPANWKSKELYDSSARWQYRLTKEDKDELANALAFLKSCEITSFSFTKEQFPLQQLGIKLAEISNFVEKDAGVFLLRGIPVHDYSLEDMKLIYAGLGSYLGTLRAQSKTGELIGDVGDTGKKLTDKSGRGTTTKDPLPFHTDRCDVVTLLCLRQAKLGGQSRVVSAVAIYNEIARTRPDLLEVLEEPFYHMRVAWEAEELDPIYSLPVFTECQGHFAVRYLRHFITIAQGEPGVPKMSDLQVEALDLVAKLADDPEFCADMVFEPGDMQILNNFVSLHSRAGYEDDPDSKRYLLRLWLSVPNSRPLEKSFAALYGDVTAGALRGGVPIK